MTETYYNIRYTCKHCHPSNEAMVTAQTKPQKLRCNWCNRFVKIDSIEEITLTKVE